MKPVILLALSTAIILSSCTFHDGKESLGIQEIRTVRTTAYTHSEKDHRIYGRKNAIGTRLQHGKVTSAAADWSRFPVGTRFKVVSTGKEYIVDDYGGALVGTDTIDLYKTTHRSMRRWGVRHVDIEIIEWGCYEESLKILKPRSRHRHVRRMVVSLQNRA